MRPSRHLSSLVSSVRRLVASALVLTIGVSGVASPAASEPDELSGDIAVSIERRLASPGAITDLGVLSCPAATAEVWWWQYWSADDNAFFRLDAAEWPAAFDAFRRGKSTPVSVALPRSASLGDFALSIVCVDRDETILGRADIGITSVGQFDDVAAGAFYELPVRFARVNGITTGTTPTRFSPDEPVLRWQMAVFLRRLADLTVVNEAPWPWHDQFEDTANHGTDRRTAIGWLSEAGITHGVSATEFDPNGLVTRWQMAVFLRRFAAHLGVDTAAGDDTFRDTSGLAAYQREAIGWLSSAGITTGVGMNMYDPGGVVTRGQMATFLMRLMEHLAATQS